MVTKTQRGDVRHSVAALGRGEAAKQGPKFQLRECGKDKTLDLYKVGSWNRGLWRGLSSPEE